MVHFNGSHTAGLSNNVNAVETIQAVMPQLHILQTRVHLNPLRTIFIHPNSEEQLNEFKAKYKSHSRKHKACRIRIKI